MVVDAKLRLLNVFPKLKNIPRSNLLPDDNLPDYKSCDVDQRIFHQTTNRKTIAVVTHNSRNVGEWRWVLFSSFSRGHLYRRQGHSVILGCHIACLTRLSCFVLSVANIWGQFKCSVAPVAKMYSCWQKLNTTAFHKEGQELTLGTTSFHSILSLSLIIKSSATMSSATSICST
ncbi:hypothetical protein F7725_028164 [Dissostichus mawsoni]|uniref:Uncharacterized protein n=1 Tax=Dissostichus mawsoni TaxID=36200 RepID=A0A7J5XEX0_DISMA|nr:hypothetical protein F7725_028164 [Dissostichus mawsoni]